MVNLFFCFFQAEDGIRDIGMTGVQTCALPILIAVVEFREAVEAGEDLPLDVLIPILFAAIVGSISFWGSNVAFGKLQELISGRPLKLPGGSAINALLALAAVGLAVVIAAGSDSELLFWLILLAAGALGVLAVLPIGGADMPVVILTFNAFTT